MTYIYLTRPHPTPWLLTPPDLFEPDLLDTDDDTVMPSPPGLPLAGSPPAPPAPTRYPTRSRARPDRYGTYVAHWICGQILVKGGVMWN